MVSLPVGQLLVAANVSGAKITVDGKSDPAWVTPYTIPELSVGPHQVVVSKEGYNDYQQSVNIEGGKTGSVNASLAAQTPEVPAQPAAEERAAGKAKAAKNEVETGSVIPLPRGAGGGPGAKPKIGQLEVTANVPGAKFSVDGISEPGWIAPNTINLNAGTHQVLVSKDGYDDYARSVTIESGKPYTMNAHLSTGSGELLVQTTPPGLEVFIDGKSIGVGPARAAVAAGTHTYSVRRAGWPPAEGTVNIENGSAKKLTVNMSGGEATATAVVSVNTIPGGASIAADSNPIESRTPTSFSLSAGRHTLVIFLSGYRSEVRIIEVKAGQPQEVDVRLTRQ